MMNRWVYIVSASLIKPCPIKLAVFAALARLKVLEGVGTQRHINNGVLLTNMLNILYGGQCPKYFDCRVGYTLEGYLQLN